MERLEGREDLGFEGHQGRDSWSFEELVGIVEEEGERRHLVVGIGRGRWRTAVDTLLGIEEQHRSRRVVAVDKLEGFHMPRKDLEEELEVAEHQAGQGKGKLALRQ